MPRLKPGNEVSAWLVLSILLFYFLCSHRPLELDNVYNQDQVRHMVHMLNLPPLIYTEI